MESYILSGVWNNTLHWGKGTLLLITEIYIEIVIL